MDTGRRFRFFELRLCLALFVLEFKINQDFKIYSMGTLPVQNKVAVRITGLYFWNKKKNSKNSEKNLRKILIFLSPIYGYATVLVFHQQTPPPPPRRCS